MASPIIEAASGGTSPAGYTESDDCISVSLDANGCVNCPAASSGCEPLTVNKRWRASACLAWAVALRGGDAR